MKESCSYYITQKKIEILIKIYQYLKNRMFSKMKKFRDEKD